MKFKIFVKLDNFFDSIFSDYSFFRLLFFQMVSIFY